MIFLGLQQNTFPFMVVQTTMIIIIMLVSKATATLLQCSRTVITYMEQTRYFKKAAIFFIVFFQI